MTATELTESTERGVWGGKSISVFSVLPAQYGSMYYSKVEL